MLRNIFMMPRRLTIGLVGCIVVAALISIGFVPGPKFARLLPGKKERPHKTQSISFHWYDMGPNNMGGRIRALAFDKNNTLFAAASGGVWKSFNTGLTWERVYGFNENMTATSIAIDPTTSKIYVGTGDIVFTDKLYLLGPTANINTVRNGYLSYAGQPGRGVYVSTDGGNNFSNQNATWDNANFPFPLTNFEVDTPWVSTQKLLAYNGRVWAATIRGLFYTDDDFQTVTLASCEADPIFQERKFMDVQRLGNGKILAATDSSIYSSTDNGVTFVNITKELKFNSFDPDTIVGGTRIALAVGNLNQNAVFAAGYGNGKLRGVWYSYDGGDTWAKVGPSSGGVFDPLNSTVSGIRSEAGRYAFTLVVHPEYNDAVFLGGQKWYLYAPQDGWVQAAYDQPGAYQYGYYMPHNIFTAAVSPYDNQMYIATENGLFKYLKNPNSGSPSLVLASRGLNASLLYNVSIASNGDVYASSNGFGIISKLASSGATQDFNVVYPSVGGYVAVSKFDHSKMLRTLPYGIIERSFNKGQSFERFWNVQEATPFDTVNIVSGTVTEPGDKGPWIGPLILDEVVVNSVVKDSNNKYNNPSYVYFTTNRKLWTITNPFGSTNEPPVPYFTNTSIPLNASNNDEPSALAVSGDTNHVVYVGMRSGRIIRVKRAHDPVNMQASYCKEIESANGGQLPDRWISSMHVDPHNPNVLFVTFAGYSTTDPLSLDNLWVSLNAQDDTPTFESMQGTLSNIPIYSVQVDPSPAKAFIAVGTEWGVFAAPYDSTYSDVANTFWDEANDGAMGRVPVYGFTYKSHITKTSILPSGKSIIDIYPEQELRKLVVATHGRGMMYSDITVARLEELALNDPKNNLNLNLYPNPAQTISHIDFNVPANTHLDLTVYSIDGRTIKPTQNFVLQTGENTLELNTQGIQAGIYLLDLKFTGGLNCAKSIRWVVKH